MGNGKPPASAMPMAERFFIYMLIYPYMIDRSDMMDGGTRANMAESMGSLYLVRYKIIRCQEIWQCGMIFKEKEYVL
jgi:hypothetical protein